MAVASMLNVVNKSEKMWLLNSKTILTRRRSVFKLIENVVSMVFNFFIVFFFFCHDNVTAIRCMSCVLF